MRTNWRLVVDSGRCRSTGGRGPEWRCAGPALGFVKTVYFLRKPERWRRRLVLQICDRARTAAMPGMTTIYDPPKEGLPYLVVTFTPDGLKITSADSRLAARTIASEVVIRRRNQRQSKHLRLQWPAESLQFNDRETTTHMKSPAAS